MPSRENRTVSVTLARPADAVYEYMGTIENFPKWSAFIQAVRPAGDVWIFSTPAGESRARFAPRNAFHVLDHHVTTPSGETVFVPLRIVPDGPAHSVVLFTIFRLPAMTDAQFAEDIAMVEADLASLKRVLER